MITYDAENDVAYVTIGAPLAAGVVDHTVELAPSPQGAALHADIDVDGKLRGLEILGASHVLPAATLAAATAI